MKSKTKIIKQAKRKLNPVLVKTIIKAKKFKNWLDVAAILSRPRKNKFQINLERIDQQSKEGDTIIVPGKVLSSGEINKKIRIAALSFSKEAERKLKGKKCEMTSILEEIEKNPEAKGVKILK